ncbi:MAG: UvrB/UvrC motif-containing protein [Candidatus Omnitrophica bacterium]|nr:UvrB/UvrC motif-containing protein [Candidatus Omnitrophota bacterium]
MMCDLCSKEPATVHLTEIINEKVTELHLCEACASEKSAQMDQNFGLADLLAGLADFGKPSGAGDALTAQCPVCGMNYEDFRKVGRLGCGECYKTFASGLGPLVKRIHGANKHLGKVPPLAGGVASKKRAYKPSAKPAPDIAEIAEGPDLAGLKQNLQEAIAREDFEEAARLRDRIKEAEARAGGKKGGGPHDG